MVGNLNKLHLYCHRLTFVVYKWNQDDDFTWNLLNFV